MRKDVRNEIIRMEVIILTSDKIPISNEEGIKIRNVLEWLLDK